MSTTSNNVRPSETRLRVGLVADGDRLQTVASAVSACPLLEVVAQSGMPPNGGLPDVPWIDDWRLLLAKPDLQAVIVARSTRADVEIAGAAGERGLHVWRLPPLARSFAEAAEAVRRAKKQPIVQRVASWWEHVADHAWREMNWPEGFQPLLSDVRIAAPGPTIHSWRARTADSAGGALADVAYGPLEALVAVRGLPDSIMAAIGSYRRMPGDVLRETEDTALSLWRYTGGGTATIRAAWDMPPSGLQFMHHGPVGSATLTGEDITLADEQGTVTDQRPFPPDYLASDLHRFAEWVGGDARDRAAVALERHLAVSAVLETAYLSARTGHPESPRKFYEVQGWPVPQ